MEQRIKGLTVEQKNELKTAKDILPVMKKLGLIYCEGCSAITPKVARLWVNWAIKEGII